MAKRELYLNTTKATVQIVTATEAALADEIEQLRAGPGDPAGGKPPSQKERDAQRSKERDALARMGIKTNDTAAPVAKSVGGPSAAVREYVISSLLDKAPMALRPYLERQHMLANPFAKSISGSGFTAADARRIEAVLVEGRKPSVRLEVLRSLEATARSEDPSTAAWLRAHITEIAQASAAAIVAG
jgi:hypothetical protein